MVHLTRERQQLPRAAVVGPGVCCVRETMCRPCMRASIVVCVLLHALTCYLRQTKPCSLPALQPDARLPSCKPVLFANATSPQCILDVGVQREAGS